MNAVNQLQHVSICRIAGMKAQVIQVREDEINGQDELAEGLRQERGDEGRQEEGNR